MPPADRATPAERRTSRRARRTPPGPPATLVLLVRHGQTATTGAVLPGRAPGLHLADGGRRQAEAVADRIAALAAARVAAGERSARTSGGAGAAAARSGITAVYASPLERARETAAPIARALGLRTRTHKGLHECDFGEWTGRKLDALRKLPEWRTVQANPSGFRFPGGESFTAMQARFCRTLDELRARHPGEAIVCVSHADPIKAAVAQSMGTHLDLFQRIVVSPCSVSAILYTADGPVVLAVNSTGDLAELAPS